MKRISLAILTIVCATTLNAQLKVVPSGVVGIRSQSPNPGFGLTVGTGLPGGMIHYNAGHHLRFGQANSNYSVIGTTTDNIYFWASGVAFNNLWRHKCRRHSDRELKQDIKPLNSAMDLIMKIKTYTYLYKGEHQDIDGEREYGVLAQELKEILPELVTESQKGMYFVDYEQIIPILVKAMQQQNVVMTGRNKELEKLKEDISDIKKLLLKVGSYAGMDLTFEKLNSTAVLYQNNPNPFSENTVIKYGLPELYKTASIMIFDMVGGLISTHELEGRKNDLTIMANGLKPGMYMYALIIDDVEIDTKRMIIQK